MRGENLPYFIYSKYAAVMNISHASPKIINQKKFGSALIKQTKENISIYIVKSRKSNCGSNFEMLAADEKLEMFSVSSPNILLLSLI